MPKPSTGFEAYRKHFSQMHPHAAFAEDGAVVLEAANWHAFQDPTSRVALEKPDVEALGITALHSRQEIVERLRTVLSQKILPEMNTWTSQYMHAMPSKEQVENLEEWKSKASEAARIAIGEILKFCEEEEEVPSVERKEPSSILDRLSKWGKRLFGK